MPFDQNCWLLWPRPLDSDRLERAKSSELTPLTLNPDTAHASFASSSGTPYETSLSECSCPDFAIQKHASPCKHMCRLAMSLGLEPSEGVVNDPSAALRKQNAALEESYVKSAPLSDAIRFYTLLDSLYRAKKYPIPENDMLRQYAFSLCLDLSDPSAVRPVRAEKKRLSKLGELMQKRIGELCIRNLSNPALVSVLSSLSQ